MNTGFKIYLVVLLVLAIGIGYMILSPNTMVGRTLEFDSGSDYNLVVTGTTEPIEVVAAAGGYFRLSDGDREVIAQPVVGSQYQGSGQLNAGRWVFLEGSLVSLRLTADDVITVTGYANTSLWITTILIEFLFGILLFILGLVFFEI